VATMLNTYVDRGIIKWSPFDALVGYQTMLEEMKYNLGKKDAPILLEDEYEALDRLLHEAYQSKKELNIHYFEDGYVKVTHGSILRLDYVYHKIKLSTYEEFNANRIIKIELD
jgi:hypothetical protein